MSDKVKIKFGLRFSVDGFEMEVDADKAAKLMAMFEAHGPYIALDDLEGLDLSGSWPSIVNASNDIEVSDMDVVPLEDATLDNT